MNTKSLSDALSSPDQPRLRRLLVVAISAVLAASVLTAAPISAQDEPERVTYDNVDQRDVASFVDAGVSVSQAFSPETTTAVVLATDANFPDALAASAVAGASAGPVLFTGPDALPQATKDEIDRLLDPGDTVFVMGGDVAITPAVTDQLAEYEVRRLAGDTRIETAVAAAEQVTVPASGVIIVARAFGPDGANTPSDLTTGWVDAISCGAFAAANRIPIYLTQTSQLSPSAATSIDASTATTAIICGGPVAVSPQAETDLQGLGLETVRVAGPTRIETAIASATELFDLPSAAGQQLTIINGYGELYGYGLAAAPLGDPILLVGRDEPTSCADESQPSRGTLCFLQTGTADDPAQLLVMGGDGVIAPDVVAAVGQFAGGTPSTDPSELPELGTPGNVKAVDDQDDNGTAATVSWNAVDDPDDILVGYNVYVDGVRRGGTPTVGANVTSLALTGLTEGEEIEVTVTSLDDADRESDPSPVAKVTPRDEVPTAIADFVAKAGNGQVDLSWRVGAADHQNYIIERGTPSNNACPGDGYTVIQTITERTTTTYTDGGRTNGTALCYRITQTDDADQVSPPTNSSVVTPDVGVPRVEITYPVGAPPVGGSADVVNFGVPTEVLYTLTDTDTPSKDLKVTLQLSYTGDQRGAFQTLQANVAPTPVDPADPAEEDFRLVIPSCAVNDTTSTTCIRDVDQDEDVLLRITVDDGTNPVAEDLSGEFRVTKAPPAVSGLAVLGGESVVNLEWTRLPIASTIVPRYEIRRKAVQVEADSDSGVERCGDPTTSYSVIGTVEQPAATATKVFFADSDVDPDGNTVGGQQISDVLYCYQVRAVRQIDATTTRLSAPSDGAANPVPGGGQQISITAPRNGAQLNIGSDATISYSISAPQSQTVGAVRLQWCIDYRAPNQLSQPSCQDEGGWKDMTTTPATAPNARGSNSVTWRVPAAAAQDSNDQGAIQAILTGGNTARAINLRFR